MLVSFLFSLWCYGVCAFGVWFKFFSRRTARCALALAVQAWAAGIQTVAIQSGFKLNYCRQKSNQNQKEKKKTGNKVFVDWLILWLNFLFKFFSSSFQCSHSHLLCRRTIHILHPRSNKISSATLISWWVHTQATIPSTSEPRRNTELSNWWNP